MAATVRQFSDDTMRAIAREMRESRGESRGFEGDDSEQPQLETRMVRIAVLQATATYTTYPTAAGYFFPGYLIFPTVDDASAGLDDFDTEDLDPPEAYERLFCDPARRYWPAGSRVNVMLHNNRWFIAEAFAGAIGRTDAGGITASTSTEAGEGTVTLLGMDASRAYFIVRDPVSNDAISVPVANIVDEAIDEFLRVKMGLETPTGWLIVDVVPCSSPGSGGTNPLAPAEVTNVTSTAANGTYTDADSPLTITITFSKAVTVTGTPRLQLDVGGTVYATYASGSGTTTLSFTYTIGAADTSMDLDYVDASSLTLNGGTIRSGPGVDADLTLPTPGAAGSLGANKNIKITPPPYVVTITSPDADGVYEETDTITIDIEFSEAVDVTGVPELTLDSGGTATYDSGTGTDTLTFTYTVGTSETTPDLSVNSIDLAGGTIKRASGSENADLSIPSGENLNNNNDIAIGEAQTDEYTSGSGPWIAPANLAGGSVTVECRGGGGTGGDGDATNGGRGGGGGGKVTVTMPVSPGESCTWSIVDGDVNFQTDTGNVSAFRGVDGPGPQGGDGGQYSSGGDATDEDGEIGGYGQAASGTTGGNGGAGAASGGAGGTGGTSGNNGTAGSDVGGGGGGGGANASGGVGGAARLRITYHTA